MVKTGYKLNSIQTVVVLAIFGPNFFLTVQNPEASLRVIAEIWTIISYRYRALVQPTINLMIRYVCVNFVWIREHNSSDGDHLRCNQGYLKTTTITVDITVLSPQGEGEKDS